MRRGAAGTLSGRTKTTYLHSVATIQLFVYLFVPILDALTPADLDTLKLSNGLKIWEPLWSHRQPKVKIFNTPVKYINKIDSDIKLTATTAVAATTTTTATSLSAEPPGLARNRPSIQVSPTDLASTSANTQIQERQNSSIYMGRIDEQAEAKVCQNRRKMIFFCNF